MISLVLAWCLAQSSGPPVAVLATGKASAAVARAVIVALPGRLGASVVGVADWVEATGNSCRADTSCLAAAPGLSGTRWMVDVRWRSLASGKLAADLRVIDRPTALVVARSAAVVAPARLERWAAMTAARLLAHSDPTTGRLPRSSPFGEASRLRETDDSVPAGESDEKAAARRSPVRSPAPLR